MSMSKTVRQMSNEIESGGCVYPQITCADDKHGEGIGSYTLDPGISCRDWLAGQYGPAVVVMFAILIAAGGKSDLKITDEVVAAQAYGFADATIAEGKKKEAGNE